MTPNEAKQILKKILDEKEMPYTKLTSRRVNFSDLARGEAIFVRIHGWTVTPKWHEIKILPYMGFYIEFA